MVYTYIDFPWDPTKPIRMVQSNHRLCPGCNPLRVANPDPQVPPPSPKEGVPNIDYVYTIIRGDIIETSSINLNKN